MTTLTAMLLSKTDRVPLIYHMQGVDGSGLGVEVVTSERNVRMTARIRLRQQGLKDVDRGLCKCVCRRGHIEAPHPEGVIPDERGRIVTLLLQRADPVPERHRVVLAQALDVARLESNCFRR